MLTWPWQRCCSFNDQHDEQEGQSSGPEDQGQSQSGEGKTAETNKASASFKASKDRIRSIGRVATASIELTVALFSGKCSEVGGHGALE